LVATPRHPRRKVSSRSWRLLTVSRWNSPRRRSPALRSRGWWVRPRARAPGGKIGAPSVTRRASGTGAVGPSGFANRSGRCHEHRPRKLEVHDLSKLFERIAVCRQLDQAILDATETRLARQWLSPSVVGQILAHSGPSGEVSGDMNFPNSKTTTLSEHMAFTSRTRGSGASVRRRGLQGCCGRDGAGIRDGRPDRCETVPKPPSPHDCRRAAR